MTVTTNVPMPSFGATGFVSPTEPEIKGGLWLDFQAAFGGALTESDATPQGQLVSTLTAILGDCFDRFVALANGVDPAYASGRMQDAIARIYFLTRIAAGATTVTATCAGASGTIIPVGAQAEDVNGYRYLCTDGGTIPTAGTIDLTFQNAETGPIACAAGTLTTIYQTVSGWDSVANAAPGTVGRDVETRREFEIRRQASVAKNAQGSVESIRGAVEEVDGVLDAWVYDNSSSNAITQNGVTIAPHSVYVCVRGGTSADVAAAIWSKKSNGCDYTGNTSVTVRDTSAYTQPYPTYTVTFQRPTALPVKFAIVLASTGSVPSNVVTLIKAALRSAFNGGYDGIDRARIGSTIYASTYYAPIAAAGTWVKITSILVGTDTATSNTVDINADRVPTLDDSNISVVIS